MEPLHTLAPLSPRRAGADRVRVLRGRPVAPVYTNFRSPNGRQMAAGGAQHEAQREKTR